MNNDSFKIGDKVFTTRDAGGKDWCVPEAGRDTCRWGVSGEIVAEHDSHGLCYDVRHADGLIRPYEPAELRLAELAPGSRVHHPYSPSKLQALEACPKYQSRNSDSEASRAGTRQHDAVEAKSDNNTLDDKQAIAVAECVAYADSIAAKYPGGTIIKEQYLPIDDEKILIPAPEGSVVPRYNAEFVGTTAGYLDFAVLSADQTQAEIIDYKFGQHAVEPAENNLQGIAYMLGLKKIYPKLRSCKIHFVMPHRDELDTHTFTLTDETVTALHTRIRVVVGRAIEAAKSSDDFSKAKPTLGACMFCALIGKCPKVENLVIKIGEKFAPASMPANVSPSSIHDPADTSLGLKVAQIAQTWAEAFRAAATEKAITDPDFVPEGYKLVTMSRRSIEDVPGLVELAKKCLPGSWEPKVDALLDVPLGKLEELINLNAPRGTKTKAVEAFGETALAQGLLKEGQPYAILKLEGKKKAAAE